MKSSKTLKRKISKSSSSTDDSSDDLDAARLGVGFLMLVIGGALALFADGLAAQVGVVIGVIGLAVVAFVLSFGWFGGV